MNPQMEEELKKLQMLFENGFIPANVCPFSLSLLLFIYLF